MNDCATDFWVSLQNFFRLDLTWWPQKSTVCKHVVLHLRIMTPVVRKLWSVIKYLVEPGTHIILLVNIYAQWKWIQKPKQKDSAISSWNGSNGALPRFLDAWSRHTLYPVALRTMFSIMAASENACSWKAKLKLNNSLVQLKKRHGTRNDRTNKWLYAILDGQRHWGSAICPLQSMAAELPRPQGWALSNWGCSSSSN